MRSVLRSSDFDLLSLTEHCGCGAKMAAADLRALLSGLSQPADPRVVVGAETFDDGAVYRLADDCLIVQTVDFFPPVASDPHVFGQIAAANALSDVYAMGGTPLTALALMCFPSNKLPAEVARAILEGAIEKLAEAGACLVGGHTLDDPLLKFGLSVTGVVTAGQILSNAGARPGDVLVLTKPLGTGLTVTAAKAGVAAEEHIRGANRSMSALNACSAVAAHEAGAHAATDVTGFGLLGHAWQMAKASRVRFRFQSEAIPVLAGAIEYASLGLVPAGAYGNRRFLEGRVIFSHDVTLARQDVMFDPQTSGGLLVCLAPDNQEKFRRALNVARPSWPCPVADSNTGETPVPRCCCAVVGQAEAGDEEPRLLVQGESDDG